MSQSSEWPLPKQGIRFFVPDFIIKLYEDNPICADLYPRRFGYYPSAQGHGMDRTEHNDFLLIYCLDGVAHLEVEGRYHKVGKGDLVLLPRDCLHRYTADAQSPWTLYWIHFDGRLGDAYVDNLNWSFESPVIFLGLLPKLISDFESLMRVRKTGFSQKAYIHAANMLKQLLTYIALQIPKASQKSSAGLDLDEIEGFLQQHIHEHLDLETIASHANLSKFYFTKQFKQLTGHAPIQHFNHMKMEQACLQLDATNKQISQVARALGYDDAYYFSRLFKKIVGLSPSEYKKVRYR